MPISCIVVDDEPIARDILASYIAKVDELVLVESCQNAVEALNVLKTQPIDLMFLDIQMPGLSGINFLKTLNHPPEVIFTTAYREYAVESYELKVLDYLLKPIPFDRFLSAINKIENKNTAPQPQKGDSSDYLYLSVDKRMVRVILSEIVFIESQRDYIKIVTLEKEMLVHRNISFAEEKLPQEKFLRIHRSFMVNIDHIEAYNNSLINVGGREIPIGRNYKNEVSRILNTRHHTW